MWGIILNHAETSSTLVCSNPDLSKEYIFLVKLVYHHRLSVKFSISTNATRVDALQKQFFSLIADNDIVEVEYSEAPDNHNVVLRFTIPAPDNNFTILQQAVAILRAEIVDFAPIEYNLTQLMQPTRQAIINSIQLQRQKFVLEVERIVDNNMRASVFATARASELRLRAKYNFPCPNYGVEPNADCDSADEDFVAEQYSAQENALIADLMKVLASKQRWLIEQKYLEYNVKSKYGTDIVLTERAKSLILLGPQRDPKINKERDTAKFALDVMASLRALEYGGTHSHNRRMHKTKIVGYGMRNLVALMWYCCNEAYKTNPKGFMPGISFRNVVDMIARGIADGKRGGNRNFARGDNLEEADKRVCDQGRYNYLICAFLGILPDVQIVFDLTDLLVRDLQQQILLRLINHEAVTNYQTAILFLDIWLGKSTLYKSAGYLAFEASFKSRAQLNAMIDGFLTRFCSHDLTLKELVREQVNEEIAKTEQFSMGLSYLEQLSPTHEDLLKHWQNKLRAQQKRLNPQGSSQPSALKHVKPWS